jgi:hypothetical protein
LLEVVGELDSLCIGLRLSSPAAIAGRFSFLEHGIETGHLHEVRAPVFDEHARDLAVALQVPWVQ